MRSNTRTELVVALLLALAFSFPAFARDEGDFIVYEAQRRSADELVRAAGATLNAGRLSAMGSKIVIYGSKSQRDAVLRLFSELDHPLRNFVVSLRVAGRGTAARYAAAVEADVSGHGVAARKKSGELSGRGTGTVGVRVGGGAVTYSAESASAGAATDGGQRVVVSEGGTGKIYESAGLFAKAVSVHVRAIGKSGAHVEIRELDANAVGEHGLVTELDMPLGEWRTMGGVSRSETGRRHELLGSGSRSSAKAQDIQLKVEPEPGAP